MRGFLLIDKPPGVTSHGVVVRVRRALGIKKVGHAGTLDPMATGLLVVAVGPVTRLVRWIQDAEKEYTTSVLLGIGTTTLDKEGEVTAVVDMSGVTRQAVEDVLGSFRGEISQTPPMVSALKVDGKRLYKLAREGIEVERKQRTVTVRELEITSFEAGSQPILGLRIVCSKGTYIRSLGDDIAVALGGRGHLVDLRRTRIGELHVADAVELNEVNAQKLVDPGIALATMTSIEVTHDEEKAVGYGRPLPRRTDHEVGTWVRLMTSDQRMLAVYSVQQDVLKPQVNLP